MAQCRRSAAVVLLVALAAQLVPAATPKEIEQSIQKGVGFLKDRYKAGAKPDPAHGIGPVALAGLALLEAGVPVEDPVVKSITAAVRDASYKETQTYQLALCLMYLDRRGDPADVPLIQLLAVRLLAGQNPQGGWTYDCIDPVPAAEERELRSKLRTFELTTGDPKSPLEVQPKGGPAKPGVVGRLHSEVEKYQKKLPAARNSGDDNSNTQFGVLAVWIARKHGVPVEAALDRIEKRFLETQDPASGGWPYSGRGAGSASMICAGLIGLSPGIARREERMHADVPAKRPDPPPTPPDKLRIEPKKPDPGGDPFFNPPPGKPEEKQPPPAKKAPAPPRRPKDARDIAVERGFGALTAALSVPGGPGRGRAKGVVIWDGKPQLSARDLYLLWSIERVGVIYGIDKIGGLDWYQAGADALLAAQNADGSWAGSYGNEVDTSFAILFLSRSNVVKDLSAKVQREFHPELRTGDIFAPEGPREAPVAPPAGSPKAKADDPPPAARKDVLPPGPGLPAVPPPPAADEESARHAAELIVAPADEWKATLARVRDGKGAAYTAGILLALPRLKGDRKTEAREALAERLTRMTADTLRGMMKADDPELRRAAVLAAAMKDEKAHVPDLIDRLTDSDESVARAARAGLKSLSDGADYGPEPGATAEQKKQAIDAWKAWWTARKP